MEDDDYFLYSSEDLWRDRHTWWLIEVSEPILSRKSTSFELDSQSQTITTTPNVDIPFVLFQLHYATTSEGPITFSLNDNDLSVLKVSKYSTTLIFGLPLACPFITFGTSATSASPCPRTKRDLILLGEGKSVLVIEPTFPRFDKLCTQQQGTNFSPRTFTQLASQVQASKEQLQIFLLLNTYAYHPLHQTWVHLGVHVLFHALKSFLFHLREQCINFDAIPWPQALLCLQQPESLSETLGCFIKESEAFALQILLCFCDCIDNHDLNFSTYFSVDKHKIGTAFESYIRILQDVDTKKSTPWISKFFTLNPHKIARLVARYQLDINSPRSHPALVASILSCFIRLLPPDFLDHLSTSTSPYQHTSYRGDYWGDVDPVQDDFQMTTRAGIFGTLSPNDLREIKKKVSQDVVDPFVTQHLHQLINPHLINGTFLDGFAIEKDSIFYSVPHFSLPWDWKKRIMVLFQYKSMWIPQDLCIYMSPLRYMAALSDYNIPSTTEICANYLLKSNKKDAGNNPLYINRRMYI